MNAYTCRQIMQVHGESWYRELELEVLKCLLPLKPCVISLGDGTVLNPSSQTLIQAQILLHVVAPRGIVFERIMVAQWIKP